jgi:hypothetical protein
MSTSRKSRPPSRGFFVLHDVAEERLGPRGERARNDPASGTVALKRLRPTTIPAKSMEPTIVAASKASRIIEELGRCGPGAEAAYLEPLRALGPSGLNALRRDFPGLLWFDRHLPHRRAPRGRDTSPIASLLFSLGESAHEVVVELLADRDREVRYYAVLLAGDMGHRSLLEPVVSRLADDDDGVCTEARRVVEAIGGSARLTAELTRIGTSAELAADPIGE